MWECDCGCGMKRKVLRRCAWEYGGLDLTKSVPNLRHARCKVWSAGFACGSSHATAKGDKAVVALISSLATYVRSMSLRNRLILDIEDSSRYRRRSLNVEATILVPWPVARPSSAASDCLTRVCQECIAETFCRAPHQYSHCILHFATLQRPSATRRPSRPERVGKSQRPLHNNQHVDRRARNLLRRPHPGR